MRTVHPPSVAHRDLRRQLERLDGLPLRPATARAVFDRAVDGAEDQLSRPLVSAWKAETELDPGWVLARERATGMVDASSVVSGRPWWPACSRAAADALTQLWRHALAAGLATLRLAREALDPDPEHVARAAVLHGLGLWAVAAVDPEWLPRWLAIADRRERVDFERASLGTQVSSLGRTLAERWGLVPLAVDAAWQHAQRDPWTIRGTAEPARLELIQAAHALAEQTPWALAGRQKWEPIAHDPTLKILIAEVQARCRGAFIDPEATVREERLTRENAQLRLTVASLEAARASRDRFLDALASADPGESAETWANRAALVWCGEPGVSAARVDWASDNGHESPTGHPPALVLPLTTGQRTVATFRLWTESADGSDLLALDSILPAWRAWAVAIDHRVRLEERLEGAVATLRDLADREEQRLRKAKLDALAEFAAGAGHELNNPLAVVVGRAQLLLASAADPATIRSLRAILTQAQRAHRILRDLMYFARPPEPRPRYCQPDEIWRSSLRDARPDADVRGVHLACDGFDGGTRAWVDPDGLHHLADALLRNAIEATPRGGSVRVTSLGHEVALGWSVHDTGRGISPTEGDHLFDPFYCGRQAGRGLGMGLPRLARFLELAGGEIRWQTVQGQGATYLVRMPLAESPGPPPLESLAPTGTDTDRPGLRDCPERKA